MKRKVVRYQDLPSHPSRVFWPAATMYLLLDRFGAPGWLFGAVGMLALLAFIGLFVAWWNEEDSEVLWK